MGLFILTIGIKRAEVKDTLGNLAGYLHRIVFRE
jgi:hypothetical protein